MNYKQQFLQFLASGNFRSVVIDFCIVACDFLIGYIMFRYLDMNDEDRMLIVFGVPFVICAVAYLAGLLVGELGVERGFFGDKKDDKSDTGLAFNSIMIGAFIMVAIAVTNVPYWIALSSMFLIAALWYYLHWRVMRASRKADHIPQKKYRYLAVVLLFPLMMCVVVFTNILSSMITNTHDLAGNIAMVFLMMMVTWGISYVPRRFVKAMVNVKMTEGYFITFLLIDYSLKVLTH
ncbi:hypothetical protein SDC9_57218 [bioreactor metagenome]|uniref:Uncharacterized protein n=1 Tax=bioreactor metagenome TaxID=1076179 RepID=A0A644X4U9_9ZZZZ